MFILLSLLFFVAIRHLERKVLVKGAFLQGLNISLALLVPTIATVGTFSVHVATGKNLTTSQVGHKIPVLYFIVWIMLYL